MILGLSVAFLINNFRFKLSGYDALIVWNSLAESLFNNSFNFSKAYFSTLLVPINWSISYAIVGNVKIQFHIYLLSLGFIPLYFFTTLVYSFKKNNSYSWIILFFSSLLLIWLLLWSDFISLGFTDSAILFFVGLFIFSLQKKDLLLGLIFLIGLMATKPILWPLVCVYILYNKEYLSIKHYLNLLLSFVPIILLNIKDSTFLIPPLLYSVQSEISISYYLSQLFSLLGFASLITLLFLIVGSFYVTSKLNSLLSLYVIFYFSLWFLFFGYRLGNLIPIVPILSYVFSNSGGRFLEVKNL